jgi:hypothetical protein
VESAQVLVSKMIKKRVKRVLFLKNELSVKLSVGGPSSVAKKATDETTDTDGYFFDIFRTTLNSYVAYRRNPVSQTISRLVSGHI